MEILLDDLATEKTFQELLAKVRLLKNGETVAQMKKMGLNYKVNWGASLIHLRELAQKYGKNHLLALKLWNKGWRETMILATLLDEPDKVSEEQMDYWIKSTETVEMVEQIVANLYVHTKLAFVKAIEYCCGKKHLVRFAGLHLLGRLAMIDKKAIDEMFESFFPFLLPLSKDPQLAQPFYRTMIILAGRNEQLRQSCIRFVHEMNGLDEDHPKKLAEMLLAEIDWREEEK